MSSNPLKDLGGAGQSPWVDMISREMLTTGALRRLIEEDGAKGVTSNPSIFKKAIGGSSDYDAALREAMDNGLSAPQELYEHLAIRDIQDAADALLPVHEASEGADGFVSLEVSPALAYDTDATVEEARRLSGLVHRPNLMIKIPATRQGLAAGEQTLAEGIPVNFTLIFSLERYMAVMNAYLAALEARAKEDKPLGPVVSVASFFVSRIDTAVDALLPDGSGLRGKAAVANAKTAYRLHRQIFSSPRFETLQAKGARAQRPLWASTGTKNPEYSDVLYVDSLVGAGTVNTIPPATWEAFRDHGQARPAIEEGVEEARAALEGLKKEGVDLAAVTAELEREGVRAFAKAFESLLGNIEEKAKRLREAPAPAPQPEAPAEPVPEGPAGTMARIWAKDASLWKENPERRQAISERLGWLAMPEIMPERVEEIEGFASEAKEAGFEHVVVLGMGGSSLAPEVFRRSFPVRDDRLRLHVLDSTEPETVASVEAAAPPEKSLYIFASKSGTTAEPVSFYRYFMAKLRALKGEAAGSHFIAVTDPGTALEALAKEQGFRRVFVNFPDIGGRFSALSYFGLVPAALTGIDIREMLRRAKAMAEVCRRDVPEDPGLSLGEALAAHAKAGRDKMTLLVSEEVASLGLWLEQLIAESTGKEGKGIVPISGEPLRDPGLYGEDRVFVSIEMEGSRDSRTPEAAETLAASGRPVIRLRMSDALDLGAEFFRWEIATAVAGARLGIDPFDQPDVQAAKTMTKALLSELESSGNLPQVPVHAEADGIRLSFSKTAADVIGGTEGLGLDAALSKLARTAGPGDYAGVLAFICSDGRHEAALRGFSKTLLGESRLSLQRGYGPRYLHSIGQLHKGGPASGLFFVISRSGGPDLDIPEAAYSFHQLAAAQALGDFQALDQAGRRAVHISIAGEVDPALERLAAALRAPPEAGA